MSTAEYHEFLAEFMERVRGNYPRDLKPPRTIRLKGYAAGWFQSRAEQGKDADPLAAADAYLDMLEQLRRN
jgi:hypothetical protein